MSYGDAFLLIGYAIGIVVGSTVIGICIGKLMKSSSAEQPIYPQRMRLVKKAQEELAFQAKFGRERQ